MLPYHMLGMDNFVETGSAVGQKPHRSHMRIWNNYFSSRHLGFWSRITSLESLGILNTDCVTSEFEHGLRHFGFWSRDTRLKPLHIQHLQHRIGNSRFHYLPTLKFILTNNKTSDHAQNHILVRFCIIAVIYQIYITIHK